MGKFLTMQEDLALSLIFEYVGESRYNRTIEEYEAIAANLPPIKVLHGYVNDRLKKLPKTLLPLADFAISKRVIGARGSRIFPNCLPSRWFEMPW